MNTWILIADGGRATIFARSENGAELTEVEHWENEGGRTPDHLSETDHLGSSRGGMGTQGSSMTPVTDPKQHSKQGFAKFLAGVLKARHAQYDELIVVAAPKVLGELRHDFDTSVQAKIIREFHKDLTHVSAHDLPEHLDKLIAASHPQESS